MHVAGFYSPSTLAGAGPGLVVALEYSWIFNEKSVELMGGLVATVKFVEMWKGARLNLPFLWSGTGLATFNFWGSKYRGKCVWFLVKALAISLPCLVVQWWFECPAHSTGSKLLHNFLVLHALTTYSCDDFCVVDLSPHSFYMSVGDTEKDPGA